MRFKRIGKCATCKLPTFQFRDLPLTVNMFNPDETMNLEVRAEIEAWRLEPLYCDKHVVKNN